MEFNELTQNNVIDEGFPKSKNLKDYIEEVRNIKNKISDGVKNKKFQFCATAIILLLILFAGSYIRLQNLPSLKDETTGEYIPLGVDPFYFLRIAETMLEGHLPEVDNMRASIIGADFISEILPNVLVIMYKIANIFGEYSIQYICVISNVVFFGLGLIAFFFLVLVLTKSKVTALMSSAFLALIPSYVFRTTAGFADHEAIGMFAFFLVLLCYSLALKYLDRKNKNLTKTILYGLLVAFVSAFTIASWSGVARILFTVIPVSFILFWLIKVQDNESIDKKNLFNYLIFYSTWLLFTILFSLFLGFKLSFVISLTLIELNSLVNGATLLFIVVDYFLILRGKIIPEKFRRYRILISFGITFIIGLIFIFIKLDVSSLISYLIYKILNPFGAERVGATVVENIRPSFIEWIGEVSKIFFWLFFIGMSLLGMEISKGIKEKEKNQDKEKKNSFGDFISSFNLFGSSRFIFVFLWIFTIFSILLNIISYSPANNNLFYQTLYFFASLIFIIYCVWLYFNNKIKIKAEFLMLTCLLFFMLIVCKEANRLLFVIIPFVIFIACFTTIKIYYYAKTSKDDIIKLMFQIGFILIIILLTINFYNFIGRTSEAKDFALFANPQWQQAMSWVRENTPENSIFVHWWDYGYLIQYLGERPTVTDGGHYSEGSWDHFIGRYVLTTPKPETALSFMKTHNVSYLLIDSTDLLKYPSYSKIGSDNTGKDRYSIIQVMSLDYQNSQEGKKFYRGEERIQEDIIYETEGQQIFLPANQAFIIGVTLDMVKTDGAISLTQPKGVFVYNGKQIHIPLRYVYYNGQFNDFETGLESTIRIIPKLDERGNEILVDDLGAIIYLPPKVSESLFAQLYILNDALHKYNSLTLVHEEPDAGIDYLNMEGGNLGDLIYFNRLRGPIKIWKVDYPENIIAREEFLRITGEYAEFDNLEFVK